MVGPGIHQTGEAGGGGAGDRPAARWAYEPDENPKRKHAWEQNEPGFVQLPSGEWVGKCPANVPLRDAEEVLNEGVSWSPAGWDRPYPLKIWCIYREFLYRAVRTIPGRSYHAFPERPEEADQIPRSVRNRLREMARRAGCLDEMKRWLG